MTLAEFLLARIAYDEETARAAWLHTLTDVRDESMDLLVHIDNWKPLRVLAECEAKRQIVEAGRSECGGYLPDRVGHYPAEQSYPCDGCSAAEAADSARAWVLRVLALPYADHEAYLEEWRP